MMKNFVFVLYSLLAIFLLSCSEKKMEVSNVMSTEQKVTALQNIGLLNYSDVKDVDEQGLNSIIELIQRSGKAKIINFADYDRTSPAYYKILFDQLQDINSDVHFEFEELTTEKQESDELGKWTSVLVTLRQENHSYTSEIDYFDPTRSDSRFFNVINRILADKNSKYRLFRVMLFCDACNPHYLYFDSSDNQEKQIDQDKIGIIALTENQFVEISKQDLLPICCNEFDILKTEDIQQLFDGYREVGLLDGFSPSDLDTLLARLLQQVHYSKNDLVSIVDQRLYAFDTETIDEKPYEKITLNLAAISQGKFVPQSLVDNYEYDKTSTFSFKLGGVKYEIELQNQADWLDLAFLDLINRALQEQKIDGQFYALVEESQVATLIFLDQHQYEEVRSRELFTLQRASDSQAVENGQQYEEKVLKTLGNGEQGK